MPEITPCAVWVPEPLGASDFDGRLLSFSTTSWPASSHEDGRAWGHSEIVLNFGAPGAAGLGDRLIWREESFEASTEEEVKAMAEAWVQDRLAEIMGLLGIAL